MRDKIKEYEAVAHAAEKFVKSVAEGNSEYAKLCSPTTPCCSAYSMAQLSAALSNSSIAMSIP